jgi:hypothetical protein
VKVAIKARKVTVTGPKGSVTKNFSHMPCDIKVLKQSNKARKGTYVRVQMWNQPNRRSCIVSTFKGLIGNMMTGVTEVSLQLNNALSRGITSVFFLIVLKLIITLLITGLQIQDETRSCSFPN